MKISLLTGGGDRPYALGLLSSLLSSDIDVDFIGSDELFDPNLMNHPKVIFHNLRGSQRADASRLEKIARVVKYYIKLVKYSYKTDSGLFHILWLNRLIYFDRTVLNYYYKMLGKKIVYTAHNIDQQERDGKSGILNRFTLRIMYNLMDHIFVHTNKMKQQLVVQFKVDIKKITVIPFGINNNVPVTNIRKSEAREKLGIVNDEKVILFFGNIAPYKGLEYIVMSMPILLNNIGNIRLIIAGRTKGCISYWKQIQSIIKENKLEDFILVKNTFIPDDEVEIYYKAADLLILPYIHIFQSGVLFLSYNFGLPVVASDVGSLSEDIIEGETGFIFKPQDHIDLSDKIMNYFNSDLYKNIDIARSNIINITKNKYSWDIVADRTFNAYERTLIN